MRWKVITFMHDTIEVVTWYQYSCAQWIMATNFPLGPGKIFTILVINKLNFDKIHLINIRVYIMRDFGIVLAKIEMLFGKRKVCITNTHTHKQVYNLSSYPWDNKHTYWVFMHIWFLLLHTHTLFFWTFMHYIIIHWQQF